MTRRPTFVSLAILACATLSVWPAAADENTNAFDLSIEIDGAGRLSSVSSPRVAPDPLETLAGYVDDFDVELGEKVLALLPPSESPSVERDLAADDDGPVRYSDLYHPRMASGAWLAHEVTDREREAAEQAERDAATAALSAELRATPAPPNVLESLVAGGVLLTDVEQARELVLDGVTHIDGPLVIEGLPALERLVLPDLESVAGLDITGNRALVGIEAPRLRRVTGDVRVRGNLSLTDLQLGRLAQVSGQVEVLGNPSLAHIALPSLASVDSLLIEDNPAMSRCAIEALSTASGAVRIAGNTKLVELSLGALVTVLGDIDVLDNAALSVLEMTALEDVHGALTIALNARLESLAAQRLTRVGRGLSLVANDTLASMALSSLSSVGRLEIEDNQALPTDSVSALQAAVQ